ncbi:MAG: L-histidine N(alpha)-methyltransferase [Gammaproteobacteria bacterium]|nr:L-histidine N(alpha)-methyltransferase [Gammaproteobacteria bacterium]
MTQATNSKPTTTNEHQFYDFQPHVVDYKTDIITGLSAEQRYISPKYFYDERGSSLFVEICKTDEYYPTRTETAIIHEHIEDITATIGANCLLVEPGSGDSAKVRLLLDVLKPLAYCPMDISKSYLEEEARKLAAEFPWLNVHAVCTDFTTQLEIPANLTAPNTVAFFPGSTIGNFTPDDAVVFLKKIAAMLCHDGGLLIGVDLIKDSHILNAAYNDAQGVTAEFNLNQLHRINRELDANFEVEKFRHYAFYNEAERRIEMHLVCEKQQTIIIDKHSFEFKVGDSIQTEYSHKYTLQSFIDLAAKAGFSSVKTWTDSKQLFSLFYFKTA